MGQHLYISTGEISGEQHGARLATALRERASDLTLSGMGSERLRDAGVEIAVDASAIRVMGFVEVVSHLPAIRRAFKTALHHIKTTKPDAVILVDYPGFHQRLAKSLRKLMPDLPIYYYILPKAWAWNERRVKLLAKTLTAGLSILPFEPTWYEARGLPATYVGNPVMDAVMDVETSGAGPALRQRLGLEDATRLVSLFPGSRKKEIAFLLPRYLAAAEELRRDLPDLSFALAVAPGMTRDDLSTAAPVPEWITLVDDGSLPLLAASQYVFAKSGTTTLEAALLETPMVVAYGGSAVSAWLARRFVKLKHFSLPNLIACGIAPAAPKGDRPAWRHGAIVPELFQNDVTGPALAAEAKAILTDEASRSRMTEALRHIRTTIGKEPAACRAAEAILNKLRG